MDDALKKSGFRFKKKYGQNFLNDKNLLRAIAEDAEIDKTSVVLEIGAGAGALTRVLSERAGRVIAYEIDLDLKSVLSETLSGCENVEVVFRDFFKEDLREFEQKIGRYAVVSNLPYYLTTPIVLRFVEESEKCSALTVMVQEEVARRFCAKEGTSEYGAVTAAICRRGTCRMVRKVPRDLFFPRPNVDSAVVRMDFTQGGFSVEDGEMYRRVLRCAFGNRRKTIENNLMESFRLSRSGAEKILGEAGICGSVRGETLSPPRLGALSDVLFKIQCHKNS